MEKLPKTAVRIPCNATVKNYTVATLQRLGLDAGPGKVYNKLVSGEGVVPKANKEVNDLVDLLLKKIPLFLPPVPPTAAEIGRYKEFNQKWSENIQKMKQSQFTPVYLRDEVNKVLERKQYSQCCKRIHLVWCLSLKGEKHMTPEKIADAIIEYDGTDWDNMPPLKNDAAYHVRLATATDEEKEKFLETVEFIYALSSQSAAPNLVEKLQNDLEVLSEIDEWKDNLTSYKYAERYKELVSRLQTAPGVPQKKRGARKSVKPTATKLEGMTDESKTNIEEPMKDSAASPKPVLLQQQPDGENRNEKPDNPDNGKDDTQPKEDYNITQEEIWNINKRMLQEYLDGLSRNDSEAQRRIKEAAAEIDYFSMMENFDDLFDELKRSVQNYQRPFKGGWAVGIIRNKVETDKSQQHSGLRSPLEHSHHVQDSHEVGYQRDTGSPQQTDI